MQSPSSQDTLRVEKQRQFVRAMSKSIQGQPLTQAERALLDALFETLLRGEDVSELTGVKRPHTRRSTDPVHIALHYLCLTQLMGTPAEVAWDMVGEAWGLKRRDVQWLIARNREPALATLWQYAAAPERLLSVCERHARGARPERDRSAPAALTQRHGDALVPMLARLCGAQTPACQ
jgi:hypothetical protein